MHTAQRKPHQWDAALHPLPLSQFHSPVRIALQVRHSMNMKAGFQKRLMGITEGPDSCCSRRLLWQKGGTRGSASRTASQAAQVAPWLQPPARCTPTPGQGWYHPGTPLTGCMLLVESTPAVLGVASWLLICSWNGGSGMYAHTLWDLAYVAVGQGFAL